MNTLSNTCSTQSSAEIKSHPRHEQKRINPDFTFDNFVPGKTNQLALATAKGVVTSHDGTSNPLFVVGAIGTGKTHLSHAIANQFLIEHLGAKVGYITANQFVRDVVSAYQNKGFEEFRDFYHALDLLIVDDIHFFAGKNRTQEEFFYAFEALRNANKQIVVTSESSPLHLAGLNEQLISRFESSLLVSINPPDLFARAQVFIDKARIEGEDISDEVALYIAKRYQGIRAIEGALLSILAYSRFHKSQITVKKVKKALKIQKVCPKATART